jgi:uncharacterized coiled-coil protein SlyX
MRKRAFLAALAAFAAVPAAQSFPPALAASIPSAGRWQAPTEQPLQQQEQNPPPTAHKIKVWTNDDLLATRTPADIYMFEKEAHDAANAAAATFQAVASCFAFNQPEATSEDTQKAIQDIGPSIRDSEDAVAQATKALQDAPESLKARNQAELDRRTTELDKLREQLRVLQERLRQLNNQPAGEPSSEQSPSPPQ